MKIIDRKFLNVTTQSCHAGTLAFFKNKPIYAWFGGTMEGLPDSAVYIQCDDKIYSIGDQDQIPRWNPILFPCNGKLFLFIKIGLFCDRWNSILYDISSIFDNDDFDINMIFSKIIPAGINGPVKTKCIEKNGLIYCGSSVETIVDWSGFIETWRYDMGMEDLIFVSRTSPLTAPKIIYTDLYGYKRHTMGLIQPSLYVDGNGNLNAFLRSSRGLGRIYHSHSEDKMNELWSSPKSTKFLNPNSGIDCVYYNNRLFLIYNPSEIARSPLNLAELDEETLDIIDEITIEKDIPKEEKTLSSELSYPYIVENEGKLHCVYTYGRSRMVYCSISI